MTSILSTLEDIFSIGEVHNPKNGQLQSRLGIIQFHLITFI